jgi:AcrR family transcriptional regulator
MPRLADHRVRIELLRAAEATFTEHGLAAAKVEDITERAGVSKGAFYLHFQSKDDCFKQIVETFIARLADCVEPPPDLFGGGAPSVNDFLRREHAHDTEVLEFCWRNRGLLRMMLAGGGGTPYAYLIDELAQRIARQVEGRVRHAMNTGLYRADIDPVVAVAMISGGYDRLVRELIQAPTRPDVATWCAQALQFFTLGLLAPDARDLADFPVINAAFHAEQPHRRAAGAAALTPRRNGSSRRPKLKAT